MSARFARLPRPKLSDLDIGGGTTKWFKWVKAVRRNSHGETEFETLDSNGNVQAATIEALGSPATAGMHNFRPRRLQVLMNEFERIDAQSFLQGINLPSSGTEIQCVFRASTPRGIVLVPAQVMLMALFGSSRSLRTAVLQVNDSARSVWSFDQSGKLTALRRQWIDQSPSAAAAWGSVYRSILDERLDMSLPHGVAAFSIHGRMVGQTLHATQMDLLEFEPSDSPSEAAHHPPQEVFVFHQRARLRENEGKHDVRAHGLLSQAARNGLSDGQVEAVRALLASCDPNAPPFCKSTAVLRRAADAVVYKLATGCQWMKLHEHHSVNAGRRLCTVLASRGLWNGFVQLVANLERVRTNSPV